jgi:hypothetical protein
MKTILLLLATVATFGQNLIIDSNMTLGQNCGNNQQQTIQVQDLNFNSNYTLTLKNVKLEVLGNINGNGSIQNFCNNSQSIICYYGYNNSNIQVVNCSALSTPVFNHTTDLNLPYVVHDLTGRLIATGITSPYMFDDLQSNTVYLVKVEGFEAVKRIK